MVLMPILELFTRKGLPRRGVITELFEVCFFTRPQAGKEL
jgi:hypothetical protein